MRIIYSSILVLLFSSLAHAEFEPWKDYEMSDEVYQVTTIKVASNMGDVYLEGLAKTWVTSMEVSKELGQVEDYAIYRSQMPVSGDFNLILTVTYANTADLAPNKEKYDAFMKAFTQKQVDETNEYAKTQYPDIRVITGDYQMRRITIK